MKKVILDLIRCPFCKKDFNLKVFKEENNEIRDGILLCNCNYIYPIINFIPRIYSKAFYDHYDFFIRNKGEIEEKYIIEAEAIEKKENKVFHGYENVQRQFNDQWTYFGRNEKFFGKDKENILNYLENFMMYPNDNISKFKGKWILDAGCGHGLYSLNVAEAEANIIGLDITKEGVDRTFELVKDFPNAHVIQGDVLFNPFKPGIFDFVFSEGVIHHTPNTRMSFHSLAELVKSDGEYSIWVYPIRSFPWEVTQKFLRSITIRLPSKLLYYLCYIPVPLLTIFKAYSKTSLKNSSWKECAQVVWDFYSPDYQSHHSEKEIRQWFNEEGFGNIVFSGDPVGAIGTRL